MAEVISLLKGRGGAGGIASSAREDCAAARLRGAVSSAAQHEVSVARCPGPPRPQFCLPLPPPPRRRRKRSAVYTITEVWSRNRVGSGLAVFYIPWSTCMRMAQMAQMRARKAQTRAWHGIRRALMIVKKGRAAAAAALAGVRTRAPPRRGKLQTGAHTFLTQACSIRQVCRVAHRRAAHRRNAAQGGEMRRSRAGD